MNFQGFLIVLTAAVLQSAGNLLLRDGIMRAGGMPSKISELLSGLWRLVQEPIFDIGFILYGVAALVWFRAIAVLELSTAYPALVALSFIFVTAGAVLLFQETLTWRKLLGALIIVLGIFLVGKE